MPYGLRGRDLLVNPGMGSADFQHASLLNLKSTDIHDDYVDSLHGLLLQNGYRFEIDSLSHPE